MECRRIFAAVVTAGVLGDSLASEVGVTWLTVPQRDDRRSRSSAAPASLSGGGRYVAFSSFARLLAADLDSLADIYVLDRSTATVTLESQSVEGHPVNSDCSYPSISADGRYLTFSTVVGDDPDRTVTDIVLRDRVNDTARRITKGPGGALSDQWSSQAAVSANAAAVVFTSAATNLVPEPDRNGRSPDIYRAHQCGQPWRAAAGREPDARGQRRWTLRRVFVHRRAVQSAHRFGPAARPGTVPRDLSS